ncbi:MAG: EAL domain-containing protein [bacterium]
MSTTAERIIQVISHSDASFNLLVMGCTVNEANAYAQLLRNAGMAVHLANAVNPDELTEILTETLPDVVLVNTDAEELDFTTAIRQVREVSPVSSFILLSPNPEAELFFAAETRAQDIVALEDHARLIYVVSREQRGVMHRKELQTIKSELDETYHRINTLTESAGEAIAYVHEGMHVYANPAYATLFGFNDPSELEALPLMDLIAPESRSDFKSVLRSLDSGEPMQDFKTACIAEDGNEFDAVMMFSSATIEGEPCTQIIIRDELPDSELQKRLDELANKDPDTGLYTRKHFMQELEYTFSTQNHNETAVYMLLIDISNYSDIRDDFGLEGSDAVLRDAARIISQTIYDSDLLARFGEHEFSVLCTMGTKAASLASRVLDALKGHMFKAAGHLVSPKFSIGVASSSSPAATSAHDFLNRVNKAKRTAQQAPTSSIAEFDVETTPVSAAEMSADINVVQQIDMALASDRFKLLYQPMVSLHGNSREDYTVFVRLMDEANQQMLPAEFLSHADATERMDAIDRWVIRHAIKELAVQRSQDRLINFMINLSESAIKDDSLLLWVCDCLREFKAKGSWLTFQFKQRDVIKNLETVQQLVDGFKKINCNIALDHFLCEQESLTLLQHIPFDLIKFLPDLSQEMMDSEDRVALVKNYSDQVQALGIKTAVTAVEEAAQLAVMYKIGVNYIQGNFIQEPADTISYDFEG